MTAVSPLLKTPVSGKVFFVNAGFGYAWATKQLTLMGPFTSRALSVSDSTTTGVTAFAVGSAVSAPLSGRVVTHLGRKLVVAGAITFGLGAIALALVTLHLPAGHATSFAGGP